MIEFIEIKQKKHKNKFLSFLEKMCEKSRKAFYKYIA